MFAISSSQSNDEVSLVGFFGIAFAVVADCSDIARSLWQAFLDEFVVLGADFAKLHQELAGLCHQIALLQLQRAASNSEKSE